LAHIYIVAATTSVIIAATVAPCIRCVRHEWQSVHELMKTTD